MKTSISYERLQADADRFAKGEPNIQHQESLTDQLTQLIILAEGFGLYDASDYLKRHLA